jgi:hypothetical protein
MAHEWTRLADEHDGIGLEDEEAAAIFCPPED